MPNSDPHGRAIDRRCLCAVAAARLATALVLVLVPIAAGCTPRTLRVVDDRDAAIAPGDALPTADRATSIDRAADQAVSDAGTTLRQGLVGLWHLDDGPGMTMAMDSSGNGNHGTLMGLDPATAWVADHAGTGSALATAGVGYVLVPLSPSIARISDALTVSAWVYLDGTVNDFGTALSRQIGSTLEQYYHLGLQRTAAGALPSLFVTIIGGTSPAHPRLSIPTPPATWTHLAGTYDGTTASLYVGGELVASLPISGSIVSDTTPLILGGNGNNDGTGNVISERFPGRVDEIALYDRALTSAEIRQLANSVGF